MTDVIYDCFVIGGGPAGLTAAIYLARYHLDVIVIDKGGSRAATIPLSRNHAGFPEGISGLDLLWTVGWLLFLPLRYHLRVSVTG